MNRRSIVGLALVALVGATCIAAPQARKRPLTKDEVIELVKNQVPRSQIVHAIEDLGIDFDPSDDFFLALKAMGATDDVIAALRKAKPNKPPEKKEEKPAQILIQTSPGAQVYLDDVFKGQAGAEGRLVVDNPTPGAHKLRVSQEGKKYFEQQVTVTAGKTTNVQAALADIEKPSPTVGTVQEDARDGLKYVWIPPGTFTMGCSPGDETCHDDEKPVHQVTISKGFWMGQTEVVLGAYKKFVAASGREMPSAPDFNSGWANENRPIVNVSWNDAQAFCAWAGGRLPTEAEWEYAARGGSTEARYGDIDEIAWYDKNSGSQAHEVAQKSPNNFGLFDVLGNVWEWVGDSYDRDYYRNSPSTDPSGPTGGQLRVLRGGSWNYGLAWGVRVSNRGYNVPGFSSDYGGLRCARDMVTTHATLPDLSGSIRVQTSPGAEVYLDDSKVGVADSGGGLTIHGIAPGSHELWVTASGKPEFRQSVVVMTGNESRIEAALAEGGGAYTVGGEISAPSCYYEPEPPYSKEARKAKHQGVVRLIAVVEPNGTITDVEVIKPLGLGLDGKAVETVKTWKCHPGEKNGTPVPVRVMIEVNFRLFK